MPCAKNHQLEQLCSRFGWTVKAPQQVGRLLCEQFEASGFGAKAPVKKVGDFHSLIIATSPRRSLQPRTLSAQSLTPN